MLEDRALLSATFSLTDDALVLDGFTQVADENLIVRGNGSNYEFELSEGVWFGDDGGGVVGTGTSVLQVDRVGFVGAIGVEASQIRADVSLQSGDFSTLSGVNISGAGVVTQDDGHVLAVSHFFVTAERVSIFGEVVAAAGDLYFGAARNVLVRDGSVSTTSGAIRFETLGFPMADGGSFAGIEINGAAITTDSGDIYLSGQGGDELTGNEGVLIVEGASVVAGGTSSVEIVGLGGRGTGNNVGVFIGSDTVVSANTVSIRGTAGPSDGSNIGIWISAGTVAARDGGVVLEGQGGDGPISYSFGVYVAGGQILASGSGDVTVTGWGGESSPGSFDEGVRIYHQSLVRAEDGDIRLIGRSNSQPVTILNGSVVEATGAGNITISAVEIPGAVDAGTVFVLNTPESSGPQIVAAGGTILIEADSLLFGLEATISNPTGQVTIRPKTAGRDVVVGNRGGTSNIGLELYATQFSRIEADRLMIGSDEAGDLRVTEALSPNVKSLLQLVAGGDVTIAADVDLQGNEGASIEVQAGGDLVQTGSAQVLVAAVQSETPIDAGALDTSFSNDGTMQYLIGAGTPYGGRFEVSAVQSDGKLLIAGGRSLIRFNVDGSVDTAFGDGGTVVLPAIAQFIEIQDDGKILVLGETDGIMGPTKFILSRHHADGSTDFGFGDEFGESGSTGFTIGGAPVTGMALQADGKILISSYHVVGEELLIIRLDSNGDRDLTFGNDAVSRTVMSGAVVSNGVLARPDGRIVHYGTRNGKIFVAQYLLTGERDLSFGIDGLVIAASDLEATVADIQLRVDGRLVLVGPAGEMLDATSGIQFVSFHSDGRPDSLFDDDGVDFVPVDGIAKDSPIRYLSGFTVLVALTDGGVRISKFTPSRFIGIAIDFDQLGGDGDFDEAMAKDILVDDEGRIFVVGTLGHSPRTVALARYIGPNPPLRGEIVYRAKNIEIGQEAIVDAGVGDVRLAATEVLLIDGEVLSGVGRVAISGEVLSGTGVIQRVLIVPEGMQVKGTAENALDLTVGGLTLATGSTFDVVVGGGGVSSDMFVVNGAVTILNAALNVQFASSVSSGQGFVLIANDGSDPVIGTFAELPEGSIVGTAEGRAVRISYRGGDGNDVVLIANADPVAEDDRYEIHDQGSVTARLTANDSDPDREVLSVSQINEIAIGVGQTIVLPSGAKVTVNPDRTMTYDAAGAFDFLKLHETATDSYRYVVDDGKGGKATANVEIVIHGVEVHFVADVNPAATDLSTGQYDSDLDVGANGMVVMAWVHRGSGGDREVRFRRYNAAGDPLDGADRSVSLRTPRVERAPSVVVATDGAFAIGYEMITEGIGGSAFVDFYNNAGEFIRRVELFDIQTASRIDVDLAVTPAGNIVAVWQETHAVNWVMARVFDGQGNALTNRIVVASTEIQWKMRPSVAVGQAGSFVVVYETVNGIEYQRFSTNGERLEPVRSASVDLTPLDIENRRYLRSEVLAPFVARSANGSFVIAYNLRVGYSWEIDGYWQLFDVSGNRVASGAIDETITSLDMDDLGNFVIGHTLYNVSGEYEAKTTFYNALGRQVRTVTANREVTGEQVVEAVAIQGSRLITSYRTPGADQRFSIVQLPPGKSVGVARANGSGGLTFYLDSNGNRKFDSSDAVFNFGLAGDHIVIGDWNKDGIADVGVARSNGSGGLTFFLDSNGNQVFDPDDVLFNFGLIGDGIVVGDWNGDGIDDVGVTRSNGLGGLMFFIDSNGNRSFDSEDRISHFGLEGDQAVVGDWNGDGFDNIGVARTDSDRKLAFWLDSNSNWSSDWRDVAFKFGMKGDRVVVGDWGGDRVDTVAVARTNTRGGQRVILDANENYQLDLADELFSFDFGLPGDLLLAGAW